MYWYGSRWYDDSLGRFNQPDTVTPQASQGTQAWDRLAYVNNNPLNHTDPTGHCFNDTCSPDDHSSPAPATSGGNCGAAGNHAPECQSSGTQPSSTPNIVEQKAYDDYQAAGYYAAMVLANNLYARGPGSGGMPYFKGSDFSRGADGNILPIDPLALEPKGASSYTTLTELNKWATKGDVYVIPQGTEMGPNLEAVPDPNNPGHVFTGPNNGNMSRSKLNDEYQSKFSPDPLTDEEIDSVLNIEAGGGGWDPSNRIRQMLK